MHTRSKDFVTAVYATLHNSSKENVRAANPKFYRRNGVWFLARDRARD